MGLDAGPEVLYHLANHLDEAQAIVSKGPLGAAIALGRLEARFAKGQEQPKPRVSAAPKPAPSTARGVAVGGEVKGDTDDLDAFSASFFATRKRK
jgi:3-phosphoglycerate kinase